MRPPSMKSTRSQRASGTRRPLLGDEHGARQVLDQVEERFRRRRGRAATSARRAAAAAGRSARADASDTRCSSPPDSSAVTRSASGSAPTSASASSTRGQISSGGDADVLEAERDLVRDLGHHDLVLRVLEDRRDDAGELRRSCLARVDPADDAPCRRRRRRGSAARDRRARGASVDFPDPDGPSKRDVLAVAELQRDVVEHRRTGSVGEAEPIDDR